jgi:hypothetical protein
MTTRADYTTVDAVRRLSLSTDNSLRDEALLSIIQATAREIDGIAGEQFYPRVETRYYDTPATPLLNLDAGLLEVTTLTNGDSTAFAASGYKLYPLNSYPKHGVRALASSSVQWTADSSGDYEGAVSLDGVWGYHEDYDNAWESVTTLSTAISTTTSTTCTVPANKIVSGDLLKVGSEFVYVSGLLEGATDTLTIERGVNGSTAAAHLVSSTLYRWTYPVIEKLCRDAAVAYWRLRANPVGETIVVGGEQFSTPKDVHEYINRRLNSMGMLPVVFG